MVKGKTKKLAVIELNYIEGCASFKGKVVDTSGTTIYKLKATAYSAGTNPTTGDSWTVFKGKAKEVKIVNFPINHRRKPLSNKPLPLIKNLLITLFSKPFGEINGSIGKDIRFEGRKIG